MVWVIKNGDPVSRDGEAIEFTSIEKARNYVMNQIWVSKSLTFNDFGFYIW